MTHLLFAAAVLSASLAAEPAKPAAPAEAAAASEKKAKAEPAKKAAAPAPKDLSSPALKDALAALLGPCAPEMAKIKVSAVEVLDADQLNARLEKSKSEKPKAELGQRFIEVTYELEGKKATSVRQVTSYHMLTTEQAQALVGEKLCVIVD